MHLTQEGNISFNNALFIYGYYIYDVEHMAKDHSERKHVGATTQATLSN